MWKASMDNVNRESLHERIAKTMTTNEPNLAAEIARLQDLRTDTTTREYTIAQWLVITRQSEALAVARSGLERYANPDIQNQHNYKATMNVDDTVTARETIAQIDKITGGVDGVVYLDDEEQVRLVEMYAKAKAFDRLKAMKVDEAFVESVPLEAMNIPGDSMIIIDYQAALNHAIKLAESQESEGENE